MDTLFFNSDLIFKIEWKKGDCAHMVQDQHETSMIMVRSTAVSMDTFTQLHQKLPYIGI